MINGKDFKKKVRKEKRRRFKWSRGLTKQIVYDIVNKYECQKVEFFIDDPIVVCKLKGKAGDVGFGYAICSVLDKFDIRVGKCKAAGRALKALYNRMTSLPVRCTYNDFPMSWQRRQIERVMDFPLGHKSVFLANIHLERP
jgi:hypothetical protein